MKKFLNLFFVTLIMLTALTGCGEPDPAEGKTKVVFWHAMGGTLGDVLNNMIDRFNSENPDIYIKSQFIGNYQTLSQKLMAASQVNGTPTMAQSYEAWTQNFIDADILTPVQNFIDKEKDMKMDDFFKVMVENNTFNDKIYSFPFNKSMPILYINKDMLKEAGIDKIPSTQKELLAAYKILTGNKKLEEIYGHAIRGTAFSAKDVWNFLCLILQNGGKITNKEETEAFLTSKEAEQALEYLMTIIKNDYASLTQGYDHQSEFLAKKVGIITSSSVSKAYMENSVTFNWGSAPLPSGKQKAAILSGTNVLIFKNNPANCSQAQQKAAWKFIKWFTDTKQTTEWSIKTTYMPVRKSAVNSEDMKNYLEKDPLLKAALDQLPNAYFEPKSSKWYQCRQEMGDIIEEAFINKANLPAKVFLEKMNKKINNLLKGE